MSKILILYASTTGNTEVMAETIADFLIDEKHEVTIKTFDFDRIEVEEILDYDAILIGTHTWDDGELPYEVEDFYDDLDLVDINGKIIGVFGSADSFYDSYGGAIDLMANRVENLGALLVPAKLKVDLHPNNKDIVRCQSFAEQLCTMLEEPVLKRSIV